MLGVIKNIVHAPPGVTRVQDNLQYKDTTLCCLHAALVLCTCSATGFGVCALNGAWGVFTGHEQ